jgi:hypothetical protein
MTIRIYTPSGFVFDISFSWVYAKMKNIPVPEESSHYPNQTQLNTMEYLKSLSWSQIQDQLVFVGIIDELTNDSLQKSVCDTIEKPFGYRTTVNKSFKLFLSKTYQKDAEENPEELKIIKDEETLEDQNTENNNQ